MSDVIETLDKNIKTIEMLEKEYAKRATPRMKYASIRSALNNAIISLKKTKDRYSEERAKEPQECNSDLISKSVLMNDIKQNMNGGVGKAHFLGIIEHQPQVQPIANDKTKLKEKLIEYFDIGDSSAYYLTRVKEAFSVGTMTLDDFVEFTESDIDDLIDWLTKKEV